MSDTSVVAKPGPLDPAFLELLCCPLCQKRPPLKFDNEKNVLHCPLCGHEFPFAAGDGFPDLRPQERD